MKLINKRLTALTMAGALLLSAAALIAPVSVQEAQASAVRAATAKSFYESIGFTVHINYITGTSDYTNIVKPLLINSGVKYIRDGGKNQAFYDAMNDLANNYGIKSTVVMQPDGDNDASNIADSYLMPIINSVVAVEGPNEPDINANYTYRGMNWWPDGVRFFQNDMYSKLKNHSDARIRNINVLTPSIAFPENSATLGAVSADMGNIHSYQGGQLPDDQLYSRWLPGVEKLVGKKPVVATETGWNNKMDTTGCAGQRGISEQAQAKYATRLYLDYFNAGIYRTHLYNLQKDNGDGCWSLIRNDGNPKQAYTAIKNMVSLLKDTTDFTPGFLDYTLSGSTSDVRQLLLQKSNGKFELILWTNKKTYDTNNFSDITNADQSVTVKFGNNVSSAVLYRPGSSTGTQSIASYSNTSSINVSVPDEPLIIEISGGAAGGTVYEAEAAGNTISGTGTAPCGGCSGGSKVNWLGNGNSVTYNNVNPGTTGTKTMRIHYTNGDSVARTFQVSVNGGTSFNVSAAPTGGWDTVGTVDVSVSLNNGANTIKFANTGANAPDLDRIQLISNSYEAEAPANQIENTGTAYCSGCSGTTKVNWMGAGNFVVVRNINVGSGGNKTMKLYYTNGDSSARTIYFSVNGGAAQAVSCSPSGGWDTLASVNVTVNLLDGNNQVKLYNDTAGAPDVDRITF